MKCLTVALRVMSVPISLMRGDVHPRRRAAIVRRFGGLQAQVSSG